MGAGLADRLLEHGWVVDLVDFGEAPAGDWPELCSDEMKFRPQGGRKVELHWVARQGLLKGYFSIPDTPAMMLVRRQLQWILYDYDEAQRLILETKKQLRSRMGESPDFGDAWILSLSRASGVPTVSFL